MRERGEPVPAEQSLETAKRVKEMYSYTCPDIVKEYKKFDCDPGDKKVGTSALTPNVFAPHFSLPLTPLHDASSLARLRFAPVLSLPSTPLSRHLSGYTNPVLLDLEL